MATFSATHIFLNCVIDPHLPLPELQPQPQIVSVGDDLIQDNDFPSDFYLVDLGIKFSTAW